MLQDIQPHVYHSEYGIWKPEEDDILILQKGRELLLSGGASSPAGSTYSLPTIRQVRAFCPEAVKNAFYLFRVDTQRFFSAPAEISEQLYAAPDSPGSADLSAGLQASADLSAGPQNHFSWQNVMVLREIGQDCHSFSGAVGWHLADWYSLHRFCGRCGARTVHSVQERAIVCPECGQIMYPRISPVVIIAIVDKDRILLTRYNRNGYRRHALVAGFVEIGETLEDAVRREVMEEVGLRVKNIRYIESQPWPFSSSLIAGFQADVDGDTAIHLNTDGGQELAEAVWIAREDLEIEDSSVSLTWDMIRKFRDGELSPSP